MNSSKKIVLTRPMEASQPLAQRLVGLGYSVTLFPLFDIAPLSDSSVLHSTLANLSRYAMAVFVSTNAVHAVFQHGLVWPADVAIAVMGETSRAALAHYGINDQRYRVYSPADPFQSDSEALLQKLDLPALQNREVVIFRAETGREFLSDALESHHIHVDKVACYRRLVPSLTASYRRQLQELLATPHDWVVSSSEALRNLLNMMKDLGDVAQLQQINLWVSHRRIAETAEKSGFKNVSLIGSGDENLLLALQSRP